MLVLNKNDTVSQPALVHLAGCAIQTCLMTPADPKHVFLLLKSFFLLNISAGVNSPNPRHLSYLMGL